MVLQQLSASPASLTAWHSPAALKHIKGFIFQQICQGHFFLVWLLLLLWLLLLWLIVTTTITTSPAAAAAAGGGGGRQRFLLSLASALAAVVLAPLLRFRVFVELNLGVELQKALELGDVALRHVFSMGQKVLKLDDGDGFEGGHVLECDAVDAEPVLNVACAAVFLEVALLGLFVGLIVTLAAFAAFASSAS